MILLTGDPSQKSLPSAGRTSGQILHFPKNSRSSPLKSCFYPKWTGDEIISLSVLDWWEIRNNGNKIARKDVSVCRQDAAIKMEKQGLIRRAYLYSPMAWVWSSQDALDLFGYPFKERKPSIDPLNHMLMRATSEDQNNSYIGGDRVITTALKCCSMTCLNHLEFATNG